jgi:geranylgeranyl diphosphate synthase type I
MDLKQELKKRRDFFDKKLEKFLSGGQPETLYNAIRHLPLAGGKRLRPILSMLACESVNGDIINVIPLSIAIELVHNFTLVHDDIMDKSQLRRGLPSVHKKYGEPTAIIAGDLLFARAFESVHATNVDLKSFKNVEYGLIDCIKEICEGQQMDMKFEKRNIVTEKEYIEMIRKKTAVFFQYSAEAGAILGGGTNEQVSSLNEYGLSLGLGFQIWDDYLDISSNEETLGKDIGNDIRNGKKTLIACHCLNNATGDDKKILEQIFGNKNATDDDVKKVYNIFNETGSIEYAKKTATDFCNKAENSIDNFPDSDAKNILLDLVKYATFKRKN